MAWNSCNFISAARSLYVRLLKTNPAHLFSVVSKLFHLYKRIPSKNQQQWNLKIMEKIRGAEFFSCFFFLLFKVNSSSQKQKKKDRNQRTITVNLFNIFIGNQNCLFEMLSVVVTKNKPWRDQWLCFAFDERKRFSQHQIQADRSQIRTWVWCAVKSTDTPSSHG